VTTSDPTLRQPPGSGDDDAARDEAFAARARDLLQASADHLDARTLSRLTQARHAALDAVKDGRRAGFPAGGWLAPAGGLAAAAVVALIWAGRPDVPAALTEASVREPAAGEAIDDLSLMADAESLELAEEIEFYSWLASESDSPAAGGGVG
jgi:hypothetical protein